MNFAEFIKKERGDLTISQFSELTTVNQYTIRKWELGKTLPQRVSLEKLSSNLEWSTSKMLQAEKALNQTTRIETSGDRKELLQKLSEKYDKKTGTKKSGPTDWDFNDPLVVEYRKAVGAIK